MGGYQPRHDTDPVWFNGTQVNNLSVTSAQTGVRITAVHGWDDRPDVRDVRDLRSGQDGEYADNLYLGGRTITIEGEVYGSTWANLQSRKRTLAALFVPQSTEVLLKIPDPATASPTGVYATTGMTGYERSSVRVIEAIQFGDSLDPCCQIFQVVLRASDPRVYSDVATSTDSITTGTASRTVVVDQAGTYATPPTLSITGPTGAGLSVGDGSNLTLSFPTLNIATGESALIDVNARTIDITTTISGTRLRNAALAAGWLLNETSGTTADNYETTAALDLTYTGGFTLNQAGPAAGIASVALNGTTGYLNMAYNAAFAVTSFSFETWIKPTAVTGGGTKYVAIRSRDVPGGWHMFQSNDRLIAAVDLVTTDASAATAYGTLAAATWTHVVMTYDDSLKRLWIYTNGVLNSSGGVAGAGTFTPATSSTFRIGADNAGANLWPGNVAASAFYDSALSAAQVATLYTTALTASATGSGYNTLDGASARWAQLGTASTTYTLAASALSSPAKLNVTYRDARL